MDYFLGVRNGDMPSQLMNKDLTNFDERKFVNSRY